MDLIRRIALFALAIPVLGILLGGVYSFPVITLTKEREPWHSLLLAGGLGMTTFGLGLSTGTPLVVSGCVWLVGLVLMLLARVVFGDLRPEPFGLVHLFTLQLTVLTAIATRSVIQRQA